MIPSGLAIAVANLCKTLSRIYAKRFWTAVYNLCIDPTASGAHPWASSALSSKFATPSASYALELPLPATRTESSSRKQLVGYSHQYSYYGQPYPQDPYMGMYHLDTVLLGPTLILTIIYQCCHIMTILEATHRQGGAILVGSNRLRRIEFACVTLCRLYCVLCCYLVLYYCVYTST